MRWLASMAAGLLVSTTATADVQGYHSYTNVRFAYNICYPSFMTAQPEAPNSDGRVFTATDGGRLAVFGRNNPDSESLADTVRDDAADLIGPSGKITYQTQKGSWAVFSGIKGNKLIYSKTFQRKDQFAIFELSYPRNAASRYKTVAEQLSRCFRLLTPSF